MPKLIQRAIQGKKSALVGTSSASWLRYLPLFSVYTGTKAYASYLSLAMQQELSHLAQTKPECNHLELLDTLCFTPSGTSTNIVENDLFKRFATSAERAVQVALRDLGHYKISYGTLQNEVEAKLTFTYMGTYFSKALDVLFYFFAG